MPADMFGFVVVLRVDTKRVLELRDELTKQWMNEGEPKSGRLHDLLSVLAELHMRRGLAEQVECKADWRVEVVP